MKTNLYVYWFGEQKPRRVDEMFADLQKVRNINIVLGPSTEDHEYLLREFKYYRRAVESKKFAFAADLWRIWIFKKMGPGVYIDMAAAIYPKKFEAFIEKLETIDNFFIKETKYCISSELFKISDMRIVDGVLNFYKKNWWTKKVSPNVITRFVRKFVWKSADWEENSGSNFEAWPINETNKGGKTGYLKAGLGASWKFGITDEEMNATKDNLQASWFVRRHSVWFTNKRFESRWFALGVWIKKLTRNY